MFAMRLSRIGLTLALLGGGCASVPPTVEEALELLPDGPAEIAEEGPLRARLGRLSDAGATESAIAELRDIVRERPRLVEARRLLAQAVLARLERSNPARLPSEVRLDLLLEAEIATRGGLKYLPDDPTLWTTLGRTLELDGHLEAALEAFRTAIERGSADVRALLAAARIAIDLGEERGALRHLEALRTRSDALPAEVLLWEARCYLTLHETMLREKSRQPVDERNRKTYLARALRAFEELAARAPDDARVLAASAYCRYEQIRAGDVEASAEAITDIGELYRKAARLAPRDPKPRFDLGVFLESALVDDAAAAVAAYRGALDRDPAHLPSQLNLARLLWLQSGDAQKVEARALWRSALPRLSAREKKRVEELLLQS